MSDRAPDLHMLNLVVADMPASLEKVILRCLERDPGARYPFIGLMVRELQAALYV